MEPRNGRSQLPHGDYVLRRGPKLSFPHPLHTRSTLTFSPDIPTMSSGVNPAPCAANPFITPQRCLSSTRNQVHLGMRMMKMRHYIRPGDVERATYSSLRTSRNSDCRIFLVLSKVAPGLDLESDVMKPSGQISPTWAKAQYYIPSLQWIPNYSFSL
jgi:hypothetical protein